MTLPETLDTRDAILFLGSGFSAEARNLDGDNLPTSNGLTKMIASKIGPEAEGYSLQVVAETLAGRSSAELYEILYRTFSISALQPWQEATIERPWRRIYTTNFDDAIEFSLLKQNRPVASYTYKDEKPARLTHGEVIHLHGSVRAATPENSLAELVLGERSYVRQHFEQSSWYSEFTRDLSACTACFFIGYSVSDHHVGALLLRDPAIVAKTYFILRTDEDAITKERVAPYGSLLTIGARAFPDALKDTKIPEPISDPHQLKGFKYLDPYADKRTVLPPTTSEVFNLLTFGAFNATRCMTTLPKAIYVIPRADSARKVVDAIAKGKSIVLHSNIGNGKSIFLSIAAKALTDAGYACFQYRPRNEVRNEDIAVLNRIKNPVITFDTYEDAIELLPTIRGLVKGARFVITVRTGVQEVRQHEIVALFRPDTPERISLNRLDDEERDDFSRLLNGAGVPTKDLDTALRDCNEVREVVLTLYRNQKVRAAIESALAPALKDNDTKKAIVMSHLLKRIGEEAEAAALIHLSCGIDLFFEVGKFKDILGEMFQADTETVSVRSALFAEYLILHHFAASDILDSAYELIIGAIERKSERRYRAIMSKMMQFSNLRFFLQRDANCVESIIKFYEKLKRDVNVSAEPLFWLQYSIALIENEQLEPAERMIDAAYSVAKSTNFLTYQIDTQALRLYLLLETRSATGAAGVLRFDDIMEKGELVLGMLRDENHRRYAVRVLENFAPFAEARGSSLAKNEQAALRVLLDRLAGSLNQTWLGLGDETYQADGMRAMTALGLAKKALDDAT